MCISFRNFFHSDPRNLTAEIYHLKVEYLNFLDYSLIRPQNERRLKFKAYFGVVGKPINCMLKLFRYISNGFSQIDKYSEKAIVVGARVRRYINRLRSHNTAQHFTLNQNRGIDISNEPRSKAVRPTWPTARLAHFVTYILTYIYICTHICVHYDGITALIHLERTRKNSV